MCRERTTLHSLPAEVLHLILTRLPGNQAAQVATLHKHLRAAVRTATRLNASIRLHDNEEAGIDAALLGVSKLFGSDDGPDIATLDIELTLTLKIKSESVRAGTSYPSRLQALAVRQHHTRGRPCACATVRCACLCSAAMTATVMCAGLLEDLEYQYGPGEDSEQDSGGDSEQEDSEEESGERLPPSQRANPAAQKRPIFDRQFALLRPLLPALQHLTLRLVHDDTHERRGRCGLVICRWPPATCGTRNGFVAALPLQHVCLSPFDSPSEPGHPPCGTSVAAEHCLMSSRQVPLMQEAALT